MRHAKASERFELDFLANKHAQENLHLLDDGMVDDFDNWLQDDVEIEDWIKYAGEFADQEKKPLIDALKTVLGSIEDGDNFHCTENNRKFLEGVIAKAEGRSI